MTKGVLVSIILLMAIIGGFSIFMSRGPLDLDFIKPRLEAALSNSEKGYSVNIGHVALSWPAINEPLLFDIKNLTLHQNDAPTSSIDKISIGLSARHLLIGKILPSTIILKDPIFQLVEKDGSLDFVWQDKMKPTTPLNTKEIKSSTENFLIKIFSSDKKDINFLSALKRVDLKNALILAPANTMIGPQNFLAVIDMSLKKNTSGLHGDLVIQLPSTNGVKASLKSDVVYRRAEKDITFTATVNDLNPVHFSRFFPDNSLLKNQDLFLDGSIQAAFDDKFKLQLAKLDFNVPEGAITVPDIYDDGLKLKDIIFKASFNRPEKTLDISTFQASVGNVSVHGSAKGKFDQGNIIAPLILQIDTVQTDDIDAIFPKSHLESPAGEWLTHRLSGGRLYDVVLNTDFVVTRDPDTQIRAAKMTNIKAGFKAEGLTVKYSDSLQPVTDVIASATYEDDVLTILGESGKIGDVTGRNINLELTNLTLHSGGRAYLNLEAKGSLKTALQYISDKPIAMGNNLGFDVKTAKGNVDFKLDLEFPTIKHLLKEDVIVKVQGKLNDVMIPNIVRGLPLTGGPYDLSYADGSIGLKGSGQLAGRDITLDYKEYVSPEGHDFKSKISAQISADEGLRKAFGIGLTDYISGAFTIDVTYLHKGESASVEVKGDLAPATLKISPFKYTKAAGVAGEISLKASLKEKTLEEVNNLNIKTEGFEISNGRLIFKKLKEGSTDIARGNIPQAKLGQTNLKIDFEITPDDVLKIVAAGAILDLKPFIQPAEKNNKATEGVVKNERPMQLSVEAQKLLGEKEQDLKNAKIYLETDNQGDVTRIEMDAKVGVGDLYLRFKPDAQTGKRIFRLESNDGGAALRAFGLHDEISGGQLTIYGEPHKGDAYGNLFGRAQIENFTIRQAPGLAKLLSAMSLTGAQDILQNNGLAFEKLESNFEWQFRPTGNLLVMKEGRTSGSSLGLTFEGVYNQAQANIDISGTIIPLSGVNKAIGEIPIIGQILTGGKAFLAATYKISGSTKDPSVSVNPLSVLAPGFIRDILFEESVDSKVKKAQ